jgi:hypothetical protein
MTAASHALIGAAIAARVTNPIIGLPLAFLSHFLADLTPHWDFSTNKNLKGSRRFFYEAAFDVILGFAIVWYVFSNIPVHPAYLIAAILVAQLPDWIEEAPKLAFNYEGFPVNVIHKIQHTLHWKLRLPWGLVTQILLVLGLLVALGILPFPQFQLFAR